MKRRKTHQLNTQKHFTHNSAIRFRHSLLSLFLIPQEFLVQLSSHLKWSHQVQPAHEALPSSSPKTIQPQWMLMRHCLHSHSKLYRPKATWWWLSNSYNSSNKCGDNNKCRQELLCLEDKCIRSICREEHNRNRWEDRQCKGCHRVMFRQVLVTWDRRTRVPRDHPSISERLTYHNLDFIPSNNLKLTFV